MQTYVGLDQDENGGMTAIGRVIRDAWVFGVLPEGDTCAGRSASDLQILSDQVYKAWEPYGHLPSRLPPELSERHARIHAQAVQQARERGWDPELGDDE